MTSRTLVEAWAEAWAEVIAFSVQVYSDYVPEAGK